MGDRGNIIVETDGHRIYLYTHWSGSTLPQIISAALERGKDRWNDGAYLTRILFCELIQNDVLGTTGYGISATMCDGGKDIIVNVNAQTVDGKPFQKYIDYNKKG
jgi:hypothetical protein